VWKAGTTAFPSTPSSASFSGLGLRDLFDPALMAAAPVSLLRYPLAWLYRSPLPFLTLIFGAVFVSVLPDLLMYAATGSGSGDQGFAISAGMSVAERVDALAQEDPQAVLSAAAGAGGGLLVAVAEIVLFARVFLVGGFAQVCACAYEMLDVYRCIVNDINDELVTVNFSELVCMCVCLFKCWTRVDKNICNICIYTYMYIWIDLSVCIHGKCSEHGYIIDVWVYDTYTI